jgi:hypothetical protein
MSDYDLLHHYIEATKESTDRTRKILLIMLVASIVIATACWNTRVSGWVNSRLAMAKAVDDILVKPPDAATGTPARSVAPGQEALYEKADELIKSTGRTPNQARQGLLWAQKVRTEQLSQIQVPILGISLDVNDLGLLGGVTLIVMLMWLNYSLWHQSNNLKIAFAFARQLDEKSASELKDPTEENRVRWLYHTYQNLAMRQVLTIPPRAASIKKLEPGARKLWMRKLSKSLYALPFAVQFAVVLHDWLTAGIGKELNPWATWTVLIAGSVFLVFIGVLTVTCFGRWKETFETWNAVSMDI